MSNSSVNMKILLLIGFMIQLQVYAQRGYEAQFGSQYGAYGYGYDQYDYRRGGKQEQPTPRPEYSTALQFSIDDSGVVSQNKEWTQL